MKKDNFQIILLLAFLFVSVWYFFFSSRAGNLGFSKNQSQSALQTQENNEGPITVKITPLFSLGEGESQWKFDVVLNSHTTDIANDMVKDSTLIDDKGVTYQPVAWEGDAPGGHHREGTLIFNTISPRPKEIKLEIRNVGNVPTRIFTWN